MWKKYCEEHKIGLDGRMSVYNTNDDTCFKQFFEECDTNRFRARTIMVDTDPSTIEAIESSSMSRCIYDTCGYGISGKEDCANNFARGMYTVGKHVVEKFNDRCRMMVDNCENVQGFIVNHSVKFFNWSKTIYM